MDHSPRNITLPVAIVSPTDVARLSREIEAIDNFFREQSIRKSGDTNAMPRLSKLLDKLTADNQLNLLQESDRKIVLDILQQLHQRAPVLHISFSVDPPGPYVQKIVAWLRSNVNRYVLVTVGLQPNIGAGCVVRTTNKLFDMSLREYFASKRDFFIQKMHDAITESTNPQETVSNEAKVTPTEVPPKTSAQQIAVNVIHEGVTS